MTPIQEWHKIRLNLTWGGDNRHMQQVDLTTLAWWFSLNVSQLAIVPRLRRQSILEYNNLIN